MTLKQLSENETARIVSVRVTGEVRRRFVEMGVTTGAIVSVQRTAPLGDPISVQINNQQLAIRKADAQQIIVERA